MKQALATQNPSKPAYFPQGKTLYKMEDQTHRRLCEVGNGFKGNSHRFIPSKDKWILLLHLTKSTVCFFQEIHFNSHLFRSAH